MYNPLPFLPKKLQKIINAIKAKKLHPKIVFFSIGLIATIWFLIRVIPKPSRANYPCMKATAPFMSSFIIYLLSLGGAVLAIKRTKYLLEKSKYLLAFLFIIMTVILILLSKTQNPNKLSAENVIRKNYFIPNQPIGEAKGIFPGRVVWAWDPAATNENCSNSSNNNGIIDPGDDAWFMSFNNNQTVIDSMIIKSLLALTGASDNADAWDKLFKFYNINHGNGNIGYTTGQKIFIKINATSAYGGVASGRYYADLSRTDILSVNDFVAETNPYIVLSVIRQLVTVAQVPEDKIYVGDPARNIYKEFYDLWHGIFPNVNYLGNNLIHTELNIISLGRLPVVVTTNDKVFFSDHGTIMTEAITDKLFTIFDDIDYLINIPTLKAHSTAGISIAAKNHFGSFTRQWAMQLHPGLMDGVDNPTRLGYGLYRVQTDIMMHKLLSGKNLLILVDALYPSEDALGVPFKWTSIPFENDWCSSIFMSLDPVAIESVGHDFLRTEYNGPTIAESRPNWFGVDDYLHQAADSSLWPPNITYDPDNDGILYASLGVHEHWNDSLHKQYTRDLGIGYGIELYKVHEHGNGFSEVKNQMNIRIYPNPAKDFINISNSENNAIIYSLYDLSGKEFLFGKIEANSAKIISLTNLYKGVYFMRIKEANKQQSLKIIKL